MRRALKSNNLVQISSMQQQGPGGAPDLQLQMRGKEEEVVLATWDCGSPLYDSFELASLHHVLESHLMALPFTEAAAASRSRRLEHRGGSVPPDVNNRGAAARRKKRKKVGRRTGWRGSKAAAAIFRSVMCWRRPAIG